jgi:hypothetical protein
MIIDVTVKDFSSCGVDERGAGAASASAVNGN